MNMRKKLSEKKRLTRAYPGAMAERELRGLRIVLVVVPHEAELCDQEQPDRGA